MYWGNVCTIYILNEMSLLCFTTMYDFFRYAHLSQHTCLHVGYFHTNVWCGIWYSGCIHNYYCGYGTATCLAQGSQKPLFINHLIEYPNTHSYHLTNSSYSTHLFIVKSASFLLISCSSMVSTDTNFRNCQFLVHFTSCSAGELHWILGHFFVFPWTAPCCSSLASVKANKVCFPAMNIM